MGLGVPFRVHVYQPQPHDYFYIDVSHTILTINMQTKEKIRIGKPEELQCNYNVITTDLQLHVSVIGETFFTRRCI